jgi:hypothetical protein
MSRSLLREELIKEVAQQVAVTLKFSERPDAYHTENIKTVLKEVFRIRGINSPSKQEKLYALNMVEFASVY